MMEPVGMQSDLRWLTLSSWLLVALGVGLLIIWSVRRLGRVSASGLGYRVPLAGGLVVLAAVLRVSRLPPLAHGHQARLRLQAKPAHLPWRRRAGSYESFSSRSGEPSGSWRLAKSWTRTPITGRSRGPSCA